MQEKKLSFWAKENNMSYMTAYRAFKNGKINDSYQAPNGSIFVRETEPSTPTESTLPLELAGPGNAEAISTTIGSWQKPFQSRAATRRRNAAATNVPTDRYANIELGISPFQNGPNKSTISVKQAIELTQLAYYNFNNFRSIVDLLTELSSSKINLKGGSEKSRAFFDAYFKKINLTDFEEKWFLEYYRSGNVFIYPLLGKLKREDVKKITQTFGARPGEQFAKKKNGETWLPAKFIILNPAHIILTGTTSFATASYAKILNPYEVEVLKNPRSDEDQEIFKSLPAETKKKIKAAKKIGTGSAVTLPLDPEKILATFYKKQDYEPFAIPLGYGVLHDLNFKAELRNVDQAISRTVNQVVLLITLGYEDKNGNYQYSQKMANSIRDIFDNESVGRVLIADFTTKAQFLIPDIANLLDPKKYEQVDKDIQNGLNNILIESNSKFANKSLNVKLFTQKLLKARRSFLNNVLNPMIKQICKVLGFKNCPTAEFEDLEFEDQEVMFKNYLRGYELGLLTAEEALTAMNTGGLPTPEESLDSQKKFKSHKKSGYYEPIVGKKQEVGGQAGRPPGTNAPKTRQKVSPVGASKKKEKDFEGCFSLEKIKDNFIQASKLEQKLTDEVRKRFKIAKSKELNNNQTTILNEIAELVMANEEPKKWVSVATIKKYLENPVDNPKSANRIKELENIKYEHQVSNHVGCILLNSKYEK